MKNFLDIMVIDINNQLRVEIELIEHNDPEYSFAVNDLPAQSQMSFGLLDELKFSCKIGNGAVEVNSVTVNNIAVLPIYLHLAEPPTNWITTDWQFTIPAPFYTWHHQITGQGWIA